MSVNEDIKNLQLDRLDKRGKSTEQIKRHSLEANLENKPIEKAIFLITKGDDVQKLSVVENLPTLLTLDSNSTLTKIIPKIQQELQRSTTEFNIATSRIFQVVVENHYKTDGYITTIILQGIESKDPVIANAWLETLLEITAVLPIRVIQTEILPLAILKGQCSQATSSRVSSCKLIGKIVLHPNMKPLEIKKDILPTVYSLCQDINYTVRAAICDQLPAIAKGLGSNLVKNVLLSSLVELCSDDNVNVRAVAVSSVIQILPLVDKETKTTAMVNLVMNLCTSHTKLEDASAIVLAKDMGVLLSSLENCLTPVQGEKLISFYMLLARRGLDTRTISVYSVDTSQDVKGREYCAQNYPSVLSFTMALCPGSINQIYDIFKALTSDSCFIVRQQIAGVFHEVAQILGSKNQMMKTEFIRLLRDEAEEVLDKLVPRVSTILLLFINSNTLNIERQDAVSNEISKALMKCLAHLMKNYNWRLASSFLKEMESLPMVFKSDQINSEFTPQIVRCALYGRHRPVRSQATRTLLVFLRWNTKIMQRTWLRDHLIHELAENKCCYTRQIFVELCKHAIELFSNKYFKENFFLYLLKLTGDRVAVVRFSAVNLLPKLKRMLKLPQDRKLLITFEQVILNLEKNEKDRDVLANLIAKTKEMMQPVLPSVSGEDYETREKRLIEEEENVFRGKLMFVTQQSPTKTPKMSIKAPTTSVTLKQNALTPTRTSGNRTSIPNPPPRRELRDMTFLKQHFYIDAGIDLPIEENSSCETPLNNTSTSPPPPSSTTTTTNLDISENFSSLSLDSDYSVDSSIVNMTDDVKVNMRRKKRFSHSEIPTSINLNNRSKRHSSVYPDVVPSTVKRRSLNLPSREFSKIPVILKSVENVQKNKSDEGNNRKSISSNLPIPVKKSGTSNR